MTQNLTIHFGDAAVTGLAYGADPAQRMHVTLVLAHGAGAGQHSPFMVRFAEGLAARGIDVLTFNFPYTEQKRRVPDRNPVLEACCDAAIRAAAAYDVWEQNSVFAGGKSMGGRIASQVAAGEHPPALSGLVLLGYPLHPPGKPQQLRTAHLPGIRIPMLFVQGTRDPFATPEELHQAVDGLDVGVTVHLVERGDHSLKVRGADVDAAIQDVIAAWIRRHVPTTTASESPEARSRR